MKRSRRQLLPVTHNGETAHTREDVERLFGVKYCTFKMRVSRGGMTPEDAVATAESLRPGSKSSAVGSTTKHGSHGYVLEKVSRQEAQKYPGALAYKTRPDSTGRSWAYQHRVVWCRAHGRDLYDGENIHHINGNREDNRPENLELWVSAQPAGQRVPDLLAYAREIIARYGNGCAA